jgi:hypothetical protein
MAKVVIRHQGEDGWTYKEGKSKPVVGDPPYASASQALAAAGGDRLENVEIVYPEDEKGGR